MRWLLKLWRALPRAMNAHQDVVVLRKDHASF